MNAFVRRLDLGGEGPRVAIKDTIDIAGHPTMAGSRAFAEAASASRNAEVVDRILAAGCRIVGKVNLHELAFGVTGINDWTGTPVNPRFPRLVPGGSSSGSAAAVASGEADFAIGTDTGGSIRIPAACCGVYGFKPSFGRVNRAGVMPAHSTLDCVGPLAASMTWLAEAMSAIDPGFEVALCAAPRVGLVAVEAQHEILGAVAKAIASSGLQGVDVALPLMPSAFEAGLAVINVETSMAFGHLVASGLLGPDVEARLRVAAETTNEQLKAAEQVRAAFQNEVDAVLDHVDVLALPTMPAFPPSLAEGRSNRAAVQMTTLVRPFNLSGHPALTLPITVLGQSLAGLQLVGRRSADEQVFALAAQIDAALHRSHNAHSEYAAGPP